MTFLIRDRLVDTLAPTAQPESTELLESEEEEKKEKRGEEKKRKRWATRLDGKSQKLTS